MDLKPNSTGFTTILTIWCVLGILCIIAVQPQGETPPPEIMCAFFALWGAVVGMGTRFAFFLRALRMQAVHPDHNATSYRLWKLLPAAIALGSISSFVMAPLPWIMENNQIRLFALPIISLAVTGVIYRWLPVSGVRCLKSRPAQGWSWVFFDTALPVASISAFIGIAILYVRFWGADSVDAQSAARHFAFSSIIYGSCLGTVGFMKTMSERQSGFIQGAPVSFRAPSPFISGLVAAVAIVWLYPKSMTSLSVIDLCLLKGAMGFFFGGLCCLFGAIRGQQHVSTTGN